MKINEGQIFKMLINRRTKLWRNRDTTSYFQQVILRYEKKN